AAHVNRAIMKFEHFRGGWREFYKPDGAFEFSMVPAGEITVAIRAAGYAPALVPVTVEERETVKDLLIELEPAEAITIAGAVVTDGGSPVAGARIYLERVPHSGEHNPGDAETDATGRFKI